MLRRTRKITLLCLFLWGLPAVAQVISPPPASFSWQRGQAVFVEVLDSYGQLNLEVTERLRKAVEKENAFRLVPTAPEADFVLLAYIAYTSLTGFALTPSQYQQAKGNLDAVRTIALWQWQEKEGFMHSIPERMSGKLSQRLHQELLSPAQAPPRPKPDAARTRTIYITVQRDDGRSDVTFEDRIKQYCEQKSGG